MTDDNSSTGSSGGGTGPPDIEPYAEELPQPGRDPLPEPGDPPVTVRGAKQALDDPLGDAADDGARRWDPRTQVTDQREGG